MNRLIELFESNNKEEVLNYLKNNLKLLKQVDSEGWTPIQLASYYNVPEVTKLCLDNLDYSQINDLKVHPIIIAIEEKNESVIETFLENATNVNLLIKEKSGENLLHLAIFYGLKDIVPKLLNIGISPLEQNNQGTSPLQLSIEQNDQQLFDQLYENIELFEKYDETLIKKSIQLDNPVIFERLYPYTNLNIDQLFNLASGFNSVKVLSSILNDGEMIPGAEQITDIVDLMCKKYDNQTDIEAAKKLADYLFEINIPFNKFINKQGQSAWMLCIQNGNEEVFERLMNSSENVNITDTEQHSPLFYAIEKNNLNFVQMLLKKKANPLHLDRQKNTSLIKAVQQGNSEIVKEILKYCPMVNDVNINNEHALSIAIKNRRMDIVSDLIWAGGEITTNPVKIVEEKQMFFFGSTGSTERSSYHDEENIDNFVALTKLGFRINQINQDGDNFLTHFIKNGYISNFAALMKCNFNPNQADKDGNSALMCAGAKKQNEYFNSMMKKFNNLDFSQINKYGESIYDICFKMGKSDRMEQLLINDDNISVDNLQKVAKIISKEGNISIFAEKLKNKGLNLKFIDDNNNNLLMFSLIGKNVANFKYLVEQEGVDVNQQNKAGYSIRDMVNSMPEEVGQDFKLILKINNQKKP